MLTGTSGLRQTSTPPSKTCTRCQRERVFDAFYRNPLTRDGRASWCKDCERARDRAPYRAARPDVGEKAQKRYRQSERYRELNRERLRQRGAKILAREAVNAAIRYGRMRRPGACDRCRASVRVHGHHEDYGKPLEVLWLCARCHTDQHRGKP